MSDDAFGEWVMFLVLLLAIPYVLGVPLAVAWVLIATVVKQAAAGARIILRHRK